jgi:hypothetical protein
MREGHEVVVSASTRPNYPDLWHLSLSLVGEKGADDRASGRVNVGL